MHAARLLVGLGLIVTFGCGGHSSTPTEPRSNSLTLVSATPADGASLTERSTVDFAFVVQYHLADARATDPQPGGLEAHWRHADGSPLFAPEITIQLPLINADGKASVSARLTVPKGVGSPIVYRIDLLSSAGSPTVSLQLKYPVAPAP